MMNNAKWLSSKIKMGSQKLEGHFKYLGSIIIEAGSRYFRTETMVAGKKITTIVTKGVRRVFLVPFIFNVRYKKVRKLCHVKLASEENMSRKIAFESFVDRV